jgi:glycosyltransferase involved in cell wall biosynthesis
MRRMHLADTVAPALRNPAPTVADAAARAWRVAVVTETWPPEVNGVAATISRVVDGLRGRGHAVQLIRPRQQGETTAAAVPAADARYEERVLPGLPIPRYPQLTMGWPSTGALLRLWTRQRPDVVHLVTEGPLGWSALRAARQLGLPVVSDFRTNFHAYSRHYGAAWLHRPIMAYLRHFHNRCASTMVPTEALRSELEAAGFERLKVVARGVDTRLFHPDRRSGALRASWGADAHCTVVLAVGRLAPEKNLGLLVDAFDTMRLHDPALRLVLVGDGPARAALQARYPQARFAGIQRGQDLAAHYASADVFLFSSVTETYGNVVPEAMASGLAVVAYDYAAASQLIRHGESGLLARYDEPAEFLRVAAGLAADGQHMRRLGQAARAVALRQDWEAVVGQVENEYAAALRRAPLPGRGFSAALRRRGAPG